MMADKRRHMQYFWPELYPDSKSKRAIRNIANGIIQAGRDDTTQYGGFSTQLHQIKALMPHTYCMMFTTWKTWAGHQRVLYLHHEASLSYHQRQGQ